MGAAMRLLIRDVGERLIEPRHCICRITVESQNAARNGKAHASSPDGVSREALEMRVATFAVVTASIGPRHPVAFERHFPSACARPSAVAVLAPWCTQSQQPEGPRTRVQIVQAFAADVAQPAASSSSDVRARSASPPAPSSAAMAREATSARAS